MHPRKRLTTISSCPLQNKPCISNHRFPSNPRLQQWAVDNQNSLDCFQDDPLLLLAPDPDPLPRAKLLRRLSQASARLSGDATADLSPDLVRLSVSSAASQTLGLVMHDFIQHMFVLNHEIAYWNAILHSSWYVGLHVVQTCPPRLWGAATTAARDWWVSGHFPSIHRLSHPIVKGGFRALYWASRAEVQRNQRALEIARAVHASSIGLLMDGYLWLGKTSQDMPMDCKPQLVPAAWNTIALMETILENAPVPRTDAAGFDSHVFAIVETKKTQTQLDGQLSIQQESIAVCHQLGRILQDFLPRCASSSVLLVQQHGRPSRLVRYWLPCLTAVFSTSTLLKVLVNESAQLARWGVDTMSTALDFWSNWVVGPVRNLIRTIRHDDNSDIAIMSKRSLETDRASLERMVLEFVQDHTTTMDHPATGASDMELVMSNVKEGDVTPVLLAYERDLRSPFVGAVRGDLVRALLIQIQKTKVDIEVAMSGIDALLKSQELVFRYGSNPGTSSGCGN